MKFEAFNASVGQPPFTTEEEPNRPADVEVIVTDVDDENDRPGIFLLTRVRTDKSAPATHISLSFHVMEWEALAAAVSAAITRHEKELGPQPCGTSNTATAR